MSEINGPKFSINQVNFTGVQKSTNEIEPEKSEQETNSQISDFSDMKAESLGRSMLFKGVDSINNDLKALTEHPEIAENSDKLFETLYSEAQRAGIENPYEEAASASTVSMS